MVLLSGGSYAAPKEYPWMVRLVRGCAKSLCGGALVSPKIVLTAHHCTTSVEGTSIKSCNHSDGTRLAILGRNTIRFDSIHRYYTIPVVEVRSPPNAWLFLHDYDSHDIAMAILKHPAKYNDWVSPICLPHPHAEYGEKWAKAAGWGRYNAVSKYQSTKLKAVWLKVNPKKYKHKFMFGTFLTQKNNTYQDPCSGDSGNNNMFEKEVN